MKTKHLKRFSLHHYMVFRVLHATRFQRETEILLCYLENNIFI